MIILTCFAFFYQEGAICTESFETFAKPQIMIQEPLRKSLHHLSEADLGMIF